MTFKAIANNPRFNNIKEVPPDVILIERPPFAGNLILRFDETSEDNTYVEFNRPEKSKFRILLFLPLGIFAYWIANAFLFFAFQTTMMWFRATDFLGIALVLLLPFLTVTIPTAIFVLTKAIILRTFVGEIGYTFEEISTTPAKNGMSGSSVLTIDAITRALSYSRVLWNQAKKAFKEKNYSLFIIKADTAVKKVIEIRFLQIIGQINEKLDFVELINELRMRGFDLPSQPKIEHFRKIRNKVVHSSHLLDEKSAIDTFAYYNKFLTRLGLRT
jgi:hypothetical protein